MDQFGDLILSCSNGYPGGTVSYSDDETICFANGNCMKFIDIKTEFKRYLTSPGDSIQCYAVNSAYNVLAFSEEGIDSKIFVYTLDNLHEAATILEGGNGLGYTCLAFANNGSILASSSNIPKVQVVVWNWVSGTELCYVDMEVPIKCIQFNPTSWRQFSSSDGEEIHLWNIQQVNKQYLIRNKNIALPFTDGSFGMEFANSAPAGSRPTTGHGGLHLTKSSIAGLIDADSSPGSLKKRCTPLSHCWAPGSLIYVSCNERKLLRIDTETGYITILRNNNIDLDDDDDDDDDGCDFNCMIMHSQGLYVGTKDGHLKCLQLGDKKFTIKTNKFVGQEVSHLSFSTNYQELVVSSIKGFIYRLNVNNSLKPILTDSSGKIIGIAALPGNKHYATCREGGLLQLWTVSKHDKTEEKDSVCVGNINLNYREKGTSEDIDVKNQICCIAAPNSSSTVFLGTERGSVVVVDVSDVTKPRCILEQHFHQAPITKLSLDKNGLILLTGSSDNKLFIINALVSSGLDVFGHTDVSGPVLCLSCAEVSEESSTSRLWKVLVGVQLSSHNPGCNQLIEMQFADEFTKMQSTLYMDGTRLLKDASISKRVYLLKTSIYDVCIVSQDVAYAIAHNAGKIAKFTFSNYEDTQSNLVMEASYMYPGHALPGGSIVLSCHNKWLVTGAPDGYMQVRAVGAMEKGTSQNVDVKNQNNIVPLHAGNYRRGGISHVCFSSDAQSILTVSGDDTVSTWHWKFTPFGKSKAVAAVDAYRQIMGSVKHIKSSEDGKLEAMKICTLDSSNEKWKTWLEGAVEKAHAEEDQKYSKTKTVLRKDIDDLRQQVLTLIKVNEERPEIERLERHEFNLDVEERQRIVTEREKYIKELRDEIELKDVATLYLRHLVKEECWDDMLVKGRSVKNFNGNNTVTNYPMRNRTSEELQEYEQAVQERKIEILEASTRATVFPDETGQHASLIEILEHEATDEDITTIDERKFNASTYGSEGFAYGGANELLESQFVLHTKQQKMNQIVILKDCIYRIKTHFNKLFDEVFSFKLQEIRRISERNIRIRKIISDMELNEEVIEVNLDDQEQPELLLEVRDDEVTVEKYISEEERLRLEEEAKLEEERRLAENADNIRVRALEMMMNGRLETNLEEELKKEVEKPEFMNTKIPPTWTEDEQKAAKEYEKKKQQLEEARVKYRKALETELRKLQALNNDAIANFDDRLNQLFRRKTKTELVILQEELKIVRLNASIMIDEELECREIELFNYLETKKEEKINSSLAVSNAKREVEGFRDSYETLLADDRTLDKTFRKEFSECDLHTVDVLYKYFKKRPRAQRAVKAAVDQQNEVSSDANPFQQRPSSSRVASANAHNLEKIMAELDNETHIPENVDAELWNKMVMLRRAKVEKEQQVKTNALVLADMNAYLQSQVDRDEELKLIIETTFEDIQNLREERFRFNLNLEVQLLLKQGQVEVAPCTFVDDYSDSLLIHRSGVEALNATIKTLGDAKLAKMHESKEFRKGIHLLAWELKKMFMKAEDLQTAAHDLQLLRVTKELQVYLSESDQRQSKQQQIATLEKTIDMYNKMHQRKVLDRKRVIRKFRRQIREKTDENTKLDIDLEELALNVAERRNINEANADNHNENAAARRMHDIITRRKLVDLAKSQASEIGMLRAEVERLRMRTFPALVQMDQR